MSFFKNLFKKKPGGTFVGNLLRGVASTAASTVGLGGIVGTGKGIIGHEFDLDGDGKFSDAEMKFYNDYKAGKIPESQLVASMPENATNNQIAANPVTDIINKITNPKVEVGVQKSSLFLLIGGAILLIFLIKNNK